MRSMEYMKLIVWNKWVSVLNEKINFIRVYTVLQIQNTKHEVLNKKDNKRGKHMFTAKIDI